jgi:hypothetical protein
MKIRMSSMTIKSVKSINQCKSVIQTILSYDIVKAHGGELKVESPLAGESGLGAEFILYLPI